MKYDLGGVGSGIDNWTTVNLAPDADVNADFLDLDKHLRDETVDEFRMSHTLEHVPLPSFAAFVQTLHRKLRTGGHLDVIQTDARAVLDLYDFGVIDFDVLRDVLFVSVERRNEGIAATGLDLQQHQYAWGQSDMAYELAFYGFECEAFDAGSWPFDIASTYPWQHNEEYFGVPIPNLGVRATKP